MSGARISDMTPLPSLPATGATVPIVKTGEATNYGFDLAAEMQTRVKKVADRTEMAALGSGTIAYFDGHFWPLVSGDLSAQVTADTAQGIYVAPSIATGLATNGSQGARVREFEYFVNPRWFGLADANTASQNDTAIAAMWACLRARPYNLSVVTQGLEPVRVPPGDFDVTNLEFTSGGVFFEGSGGTVINSTSVMATRFNTASGHSGVLVQGDNTSGESTKDGANHISGRGSVIRGFSLVGAYAGTEAEDHGIHIRGRCHVEDIVVEGYPGDAVYFDADSGARGGNATGSTVKRIKSRLCRDGFHVIGNNNSASHFEQLDAFQCRRWGVNDESGIGNTYISCESNGCGGVDSYGSKPSAAAFVGGDTVSRWYGVIIGQESGASTNAPSGDTTTNTWWYYIKDGAATSAVPLWSSGTTYRAGGAGTTSGAAPDHGFIICYAEQNQGKAQFGGGVLTFGGNLRQWIYSGIALWANTTGQFQSNSAIYSQSNLLADGTACRFGPNIGTAANGAHVFANTNAQTQIFFRRYNTAGVLQATDGNITAASTGIVVNATAGGVKMQFNASLVGTFTATALNLASGIVYQVNATKVVGARATGWAVDTGTSKRTANATYAVGTALTVSNPPTQAEVQAIVARQVLLENAVRDATQTIKALKDDLHGTAGHGLIGT